MKEINLKPGTTITDEYDTYVVRNTGFIHHISSGNHAEIHVTHQQLLNLIFERNFVMPILNTAKNFGKAVRRMLRG